jgi:hypothetical protein
MKNRTGKAHVTINIFSGNTISLGEKALLIPLLVFVLALVVSKFEPDILANIIRSLISKVDGS